MCMKKILTLLIVIFAFTIARLKAQDIDVFEKAIKPGAQLTYEVTNQDNQYELIVTIVKTGAEVSFTWKTTDPDNKTGSVTMSADALTQARSFANVFGGGDVKADKETVLWASKQLVADVVANNAAKVKMHGENDTITSMTSAIADCNFSINQAAVTISGYELEGGDPKCSATFIESTKFPILARLNAGIILVLAEIKNP